MSGGYLVLSMLTSSTQDGVFVRHSSLPVRCFWCLLGQNPEKAGSGSVDKKNLRGRPNKELRISWEYTKK